MSQVAEQLWPGLLAEAWAALAADGAVAAALRALARQSARGGTQFRELSLARTAHWLLGLSRGSAVSPSLADGGEPAWLTTRLGP